MAAHAWKALSKKVMKFNEKYPESSVICIALVSNRLVFEGSSQMKTLFAKNPDVQDMYKQAILSNPSEELLTDDIEVQPSVKTMLKKHVYDMDTQTIRSLLSNVVAPPEAVGNKDSRRNHFREENAPDWWKETGIPFRSPNHGEGKVKKEKLMVLVEALQKHLSIRPSAPVHKNKTNFISSFIYHNMTEMVDMDTDEQETMGEPETLDEPQTLDTDTERTDVRHEETSKTSDEMETDQTNSQTIETNDMDEGTDLRQNHMTDDTISTHIRVITKKAAIREIFCSEMSWTEKAIKTMREIEVWDDLWGLSDHIKSYLPEFPDQLANGWLYRHIKDNPSFKDFRPDDIGSRMMLTTTADGNCMYNAICIALYGNESMAMILKLASIVNIVDDLVPFSKYIAEEFSKDMWKWTSSVVSSEKELRTAEDIERACRQLLVQTAQHPYRDGTIFHLHIVAHLLKRPIQQHCVRKSDAYEQLRQTLFPPLTPICRPSAIHLVWVQSKPRSKYATFNHVVPAVCELGPYNTHLEECAFEGLGCCSFMYGFNSEISPAWVECTLCGQWVHEVCMRVKAADFCQSDSAFPCGCDMLTDGFVPIQSKDWYHNLDIDNLDLNYKEIIEEEDKAISLRKSLFTTSAHGSSRLHLRMGRFGPFTEQFVDDVNIKLVQYVPQENQALVPDLYMPAVLLHIIQQRENINRLLAEMVLIQCSPFQSH